MGKLDLMLDGNDVKPARDSYFARKQSRIEAPAFDADILALVDAAQKKIASRAAQLLEPASAFESPPPVCKMHCS
jgi:hypothetical protein